MTDRIYIQFAENGNIRKWQREPFDGGTAYIAHAGEPVGYTTPDSISEVLEGRIGNHLYPKGTLRPENEIALYAAPNPALDEQGPRAALAREAARG